MLALVLFNRREFYSAARRPGQYDPGLMLTFQK